ncbi:MAG: TldD/PmbA family protein [Candidatus Nezhaarchaeota archaeon]|nr:TldD/PmbA family protein [Candidatus Nezhaarchaeota archaeon]
MSSLLDEALRLGASYAESFVEDLFIAEGAVRGRSAELNTTKSKYYSLRALVDGRWGVSSSRGPSPQIARSAIENALLAKKAGAKRLTLAPRKAAKGAYVYLGPNPKSLVEEVCRVVSEVAGRISLEGLMEAVVTAERASKAMCSSDGVNAYEARDRVEISVAVASAGSVASSSMGWSGQPPTDWRERLERMLNGLVERVRDKQSATLLNPLYRGSKFTVVLKGEAACAFIHEAVGHSLEADVLLEHGLSPPRVGCEELTVVDDPLLPGGYGSYSFDDEGVEAKRKVLVDRGRPVGLLHTRWTAAATSQEPTGNGRGLYSAPKSMASNLVVEPGTWSLDEMIEETSKGFLIDGVLRAEVYRGAIHIIPDAAWFIERGEVREPVALERVVIPQVRALSLVEAVAKKGFTHRPSLEKGLPISEVSPPVRLSQASVY